MKQKILNNYFLTKKDELRTEKIRENLWNSSVNDSEYKEEHQGRYQQAILEQYKLYIEMADRISARRALANTFFLTLNTAIFALIGLFWQHQPTAPKVLLIFPLIALVSQCLAWFWMIRSYRQLNSGKFAVVGELEKRLPAFAYSDGEWNALGKGKDPGIYWPLTEVESILPFLFGFTYICAFIAAIVF